MAPEEGQPRLSLAYTGTNPSLVFISPDYLNVPPPHLFHFIYLFVYLFTRGFI